jgi:hypothetical protein
MEEVPVLTETKLKVEVVCREVVYTDKGQAESMSDEMNGYQQGRSRMGIHRNLHPCAVMLGVKRLD